MPWFYFTQHAAIVNKGLRFQDKATPLYAVESEQILIIGWLISPTQVVFSRREPVLRTKNRSVMKDLRLAHIMPFSWARIDMKTGLLIGAFSLLAVVAALGWTRKAPVPQGVEVASQQLSLQPAGVTAQTQSSYVANGTDGPYQTSNSRAAIRRTYDEREYGARSYRPVVKPRSTKRSIAIVAGGSGVGAAIGALAGGGRGAAIGALAGGGAGFIYDRLTHRRPMLF
jgi:hypothetical protein